MKILFDHFDSPARGKAAYYGLVADAIEELTAVEYDCRKRTADDVEDPTLREIVQFAWEARAADAGTADAAWALVLERSDLDQSGYVATLARFVLVRLRAERERGSDSVQLDLIRSALVLTADLRPERSENLTIALAVVEHVLGNDKAALDTIARLVSAGPATSPRDVGTYHLVRARVFAADTDRAARELISAVAMFEQGPQGAWLLQTEARWGLAHIARVSGDDAAAEQQLTAAASRYESAGDLAGLGEFAADVGSWWLAGGRAQRAESWVRRALELHLLTRNWDDGLADYAILCSLLKARNDPEALLAAALGAADLRVQLRRLVWRRTDRTELSRRTNYLDWLGVQASEVCHKPWAAVSLLEARRADSLALLLRSGMSIEGTPPKLRQAIAKVAELEFESIAPRLIPANLRLRSGGPVPRNVLIRAWERDERECGQALQKAYHELERELGFSAANVVSPPLFDAEVLAAALPPHTHVVQMDIVERSDRARGSCDSLLVTTWISAEPMSAVLKVQPVSAEQVEVLSHLANYRLGRSPEGFDDALPEWLGPLLLPSELRSTLSSQLRHRHGTPSDVPLLVLSPASRLWGLPFAALRVDGLPLIEHAAIVLTPSLQFWWPTKRQGDVARDSPLVEPPGRRLRALCLMRDVSGLDIERASQQEVFDCDTADEKQFVAALRSEHSYHIAIVSAHGVNNRGLEHGVLFGADGRLTAAGVLSLRMPPIVVLGSCWSGSLQFDQEVEPIGLPTMALLRGATAVVGGLQPLPDGARLGEPTARLLAALYSAIAEGNPPAWALRAAQRQLHREPGMQAWWKWASVGCIVGGSDRHATPVPSSVADAVRHEMIQENVAPVGERTRGHVKWFESEKGFGFLVEAGTDRDFFVHYSEIVGTGYRALMAGQQVEFEIGQGTKGPMARAVRLI